MTPERSPQAAPAETEFERLLPPEKVYGEFEVVHMLPQNLIELTQVRGEKNPIRGDLIQDILETDTLINPIDIARLSEENLREYIEFVNRVWSVETDFSNYEAMRQDDGFFYLVVAGHTRLESIKYIQEQKLRPIRPVAAKVHSITSPEEIINIQRSENIHRSPSRERVAQSIVETYMWGVETGRWESQADFVRRQKELGRPISKKLLSEGLTFANLPIDIRNLVHTKTLSYSVGIGLARYAPALKEFLYAENELETDEDKAEHAEAIEEQFLYRLLGDAGHALKLKPTLAVAWLDNSKKELIDKANGRTQSLQLYTAKQIVDEQTASARKAFRKVVTELKGLPLERVTSFIDTAGSALGGYGEDREGLLKELDSNIQLARTALETAHLERP